MLKKIKKNKKVIKIRMINMQIQKKRINKNKAKTKTIDKIDIKIGQNKKDIERKNSELLL